jgi:arylsulfatase A-like enzyme
MSDKPNLVFIMTDQQRYDTVGANGNAGMKTPNLDALAQTGANLHEYYTNSPVCVPSRCNMFTGRYSHSHRTRENYCLLEAGREIHFFRVLKHAGYKIGYAGKNHLVDEAEIPNFDFFSHLGGEERSESGKQLDAAYWGWRKQDGSPKPGASDAAWRAQWVHETPEATRSFETAQAGIGFLKEQTAQEPFAMCFSFEDPHVPHIALQEYVDKYPLDEIELYPDEGDEALAQKAKRWLIKKGAQIADDASPEQKKRYIAVYRAMISWIDTQIGRIIQTLEDKGLRENTLLVFTSDHGDYNFQHGLAKKDLMLVDSLLHVPCIFSWPAGGIVSKQVRGPMFEQIDLMPTILDLLDIETPVGVQGKSFAGVLKGETDQHRDAVFAEICTPYLHCYYRDFEEFAADNGGRGKTPFNVPGDFTKSIREKDWRYIWYANKDNEEELYHYPSDPYEQKNLAKDPQYTEVKLRLKLRLLEWNAITEDPLDVNLMRDLQEKYPNWSPLPIQPGKHEQPRWKIALTKDLAKPV